MDGLPTRLGWIAIVLGCNLGAGAAAAQDHGSPAPPREERDAPPSIGAVRVGRVVPDVDGRPDEDVWKAAPVAGGFRRLSSGRVVAEGERTEARVLYDDEALYVAMWMVDPGADSIAAPLARRDEDVYSDWAFVEVGDPGDGRTALVVGVNPRGVKWDGVYYDDVRLDADQDAIWTAAAARAPWGWTAEFRIPFSQLPVQGGGAQVLRINFRRRIARWNETENWSPITRSSGRHVSLFGELTGLRGIAPSSRLALRPYSVARLTRKDVEVGDPFWTTQAWSGDAGLDARYALGPRLALTATVNPDFGQVEADPSVVNLSAYQTFFPEKRPFFLEGAELFDFPFGGRTLLFHSRRIGRGPQRTPRVSDGFVDTPTSSTILGAAKVSGHAGRGWGVGMVGAVTAAEAATVADANGMVRRVPVEPLTGYGVASVRKTFRNGGTELGAVLTGVARDLPPSGELDGLRSRAAVGGVDVRHRFLGNQLQVQAMWAGSAVQGGAAAILATQMSPEHYFQRPDAPHLSVDSSATSLLGQAAGLSLQRIGGGLRFGLEARAISPGFEVNDAGFQRQADLFSQTGFLSLDQAPKEGNLRRFRAGLTGGATWTFGRELLSRQIGMNTRLDFRRYSGLTAAVTRDLTGLSTDATRGGPALLEPARSTVSAGIFTDTRKPIRFRFDGSYALEDETDGDLWRLRGGVDVRFSMFARLSLLASLTHRLNEWQHTGNRTIDGQPHYLFARLRETTGDATVRADLVVAPNLSLQFYGQPFLDARLYDRFREVAEPRAARFDQRFRDLPPSAISYDPAARTYGLDINGDGQQDASFGNPDRSFMQLRSNVVLRWEYRVGSTLFLVWSHERTGTAVDRPFLLDRDLTRLFSDDPDLPGPTDIFLIKLSYWLGF